MDFSPTLACLPPLELSALLEAVGHVIDLRANNLTHARPKRCFMLVGTTDFSDKRRRTKMQKAKGQRSWLN